MLRLDPWIQARPDGEIYREDAITIAYDSNYSCRSIRAQLSTSVPIPTFGVAPGLHPILENVLRRTGLVSTPYGPSWRSGRQLSTLLKEDDVIVDVSGDSYLVSIPRGEFVRRLEIIQRGSALGIARDEIQRRSDLSTIQITIAESFQKLTAEALFPDTVTYVRFGDASIPVYRTHALMRDARLVPRESARQSISDRPLPGDTIIDQVTGEIFTIGPTSSQLGRALAGHCRPSKLPRMPRPMGNPHRIAALSPRTGMERRILGLFPRLRAHNPGVIAGVAMSIWAGMPYDPDTVANALHAGQVWSRSIDLVVLQQFARGLGLRTQIVTDFSGESMRQSPASSLWIVHAPDAFIVAERLPEQVRIITPQPQSYALSAFPDFGSPPFNASGIALHVQDLGDPPQERERLPVLSRRIISFPARARLAERRATASVYLPTQWDFIGVEEDEDVAVARRWYEAATLHGVTQVEASFELVWHVSEVDAAQLAIKPIALLCRRADRVVRLPMILRKSER